MQTSTDNIISKSTLGKAYFALVWVSIFWGTTWLASKIGVTEMPALQFIGLRQFFGALMFISYFIFIGHPLPKGKQWITILILSVLNFMMSNGFVIWAVKYIPSGLGAIIAAIFPLWVVVLTMFQGKKIPGLAIIGVMFGFSGVCIIFFEHIKDFLNINFRFGIILSLTASLTWAFGALYTKKKADSFNPYFSIGLQMLISSIVFLGNAYATNNYIALSAIPSNAIWALVYLVTIGSTATFVAYIYALRNLPVALTSAYAYVNPVVAVLLGSIVLNEKLTAYIIAGGLVALLGVYLVNWSFRKKLPLTPKGE